MAKQIDPKYAADDLPKVKNPFLYAYRTIAKLLVYLLFGIGTLIIVILVFPILRLIWHDKDVFRVKGRIFISSVFNVLIHFMSIIQVSKFRVSDLKALRNLKSCIIVANHPSLLDVIYTFAFVKNADCIIRAGLKNTIVSGIVKPLYISNDDDFDKMVADCKKSLDSGSNLIIFPEGTRTPRHGTNPYKKGAARIALATGCNIQPLHIGGSDKYGLGKHDPFYKVHPTETYFYDFTVLPQITMDKYKDMQPAVAAKHLTDDMRKVIDSVK